MPTLAIDVMSGDLGAAECVPGALLALEQAPDLRLELVGNPATIEPLLAHAGASLRARATIVAASDVVPMDELPRAAIRRRKASSMRIAIDRVKEGAALGCVSAGNTGALTAIAHFVLKTVPEVERAPIMSALPAAHGHAYMLDLGANVSATAEQLRQFALMGSIVARDVHGIAQPRVGLLNIGEEDIKGNEVVKAAAELLRQSGLNFVGNVEGDGIYKGDADVVVCDGFVGNVALKTSEGLAQMLASFLRQEFKRNLLTKIVALMALPVLNAFKKRVDHRRYNGAILLGLRGISVKSHGSADSFSFANAIARAYDAAENRVLERIAGRLAQESAAVPAAVEENV